MYKTIIVGAALLLCVGCATFRTAEVTLVRKGISQMDIVIGKDAVEPVKEAAEALRDYIGKTTGARPEIRIGHPETAHAIYVGESEYTRSIGLQKDALKPQEYRMLAQNGNLILIGRDEADADNAKLKGHTFNNLKYFQETGTLYAVNDFLEKYCGVRWYMPTELGEVIQPKRTLTVPANLNYSHIPSVKFRSLFALWKLPASLHIWKYEQAKVPAEELLPEKEILDWGRRMKVGGMPFSANHNQISFRTRFPEKKSWFGQGQLKRGNQLCYSNPEVFQQVVQDARDSFDGKLEEEYMGWSVGDYFSVMPDDNANWCDCPECKKQLKPRLPNTPFHNGLASDYIWGFVSRVANEIKKTHPDKKISCCAYWDYRKCPENVTIPANVAVLLTKSYADFGNKETEKAAWDEIAAWRSRTPEVYLWDYYLFPNLFSCDKFPNMSPWLAAEEIYKMRKHDISGGLMCQLDEWYWRTPAMDHLRVYVTMKLLDDWTLDVNQLTDEYFRLFYGPAETPMKQYWTKLDEIYRRKGPGKNTSKTDWTVVCPQEEIDALAAIIDSAFKAAPKGSIYAKRVQLMRDSAQKTIENNSHRVLEILRNIPTASAFRTERLPRMDGTLDDEVWQKAAPIGDWLECFGTGKAMLRTEARVLYDDKNLYIGYEAWDLPDYKVTQNCNSRDGAVYMDDSVEAFLLPEGQTDYYHFAANTIPVLYDAIRQSKDWNSKATVKTKLGDAHWTLVMSIPLESIGNPTIVPGKTEWKVNFCRNRRDLPGFRCEFFNWSGPSGYHNVERFGTLKFE